VRWNHDGNDRSDERPDGTHLRRGRCVRATEGEALPCTLDGFAHQQHRGLDADRGCSMVSG
jgi:hypothetical protein